MDALRVLEDVPLAIDPDEVLRFQGYKAGVDVPSADVLALFDDALALGRTLMRPRAVLRTLPVARDGDRLTAGGVSGYSLGARAGLRQATRLPLGFVARVDTDRALHGAGFAFGFSIGAQDLAGIVATTPGTISGIDALDLYGISSRRIVPTRSVRD